MNQNKDYTTGYVYMHTCMHMYMYNIYMYTYIPIIYTYMHILHYFHIYACV